MSKYEAAGAAMRAHLRFAYGMIAVLIAGCAGLGYGWYKSPEHLKIDIPPNLQHGAIVRPGEYYAATVEAFANLIFKELNRWYEDGYTEFGQNIFNNQAYLTPRYREWLVNDMENKARAGELKERERFTLSVKQVESVDNVRSFDDGSWLVDVRVIVVERIAGQEVKRVGVHYPLRVVRIDISPQKNVWGLALDGYPEGMQETRLENAEAVNDV